MLNGVAGTGGVVLLNYFDFAAGRFIDVVSHQSEERFADRNLRIGENFLCHSEIFNISHSFIYDK